MKSQIFLLSVAIAASGVSVAQAKSTVQTVIWANSNKSSSGTQADLDTCKARSISNSATQDSFSSGLISNLIFALRFTSGIRADFIKKCMYHQGYRAIPLSDAEQAEINSLDSDATAVWMSRFYHGDDFARRLADANPAPFPDASAVPFAYGAIRFDPIQLHVADGIVAPKGILLRGRASYRNTARLTADVHIDALGTRVLRAGAIMHEAVFGAEAGKEKTYWCGAYKGTLGLNFGACARNDDEGYAVYWAKGAAWIATDLDLGQPEEVTTDPYQLQDVPGSGADPLEFALVVRKIGSASVALEGLVTSGNDTETVWQKDLSLNSDGEGVLPFWTYRLVVKRTGSGVTAAFAADGDGSGLPYGQVKE